MTNVRFGGRESGHELENLWSLHGNRKRRRYGHQSITSGTTIFVICGDTYDGS